MAEYGILFEFTCPNGHTYRSAKVYRRARTEQQAINLFTGDVHTCAMCNSPWKKQVSAAVYPFKMDEKMQAYIVWKAIPLTFVGPEAI